MKKGLLILVMLLLLTGCSSKEYIVECTQDDGPINYTLTYNEKNEITKATISHTYAYDDETFTEEDLEKKAAEYDSIEGIEAKLVRGQSNNYIEQEINFKTLDLTKVDEYEPIYQLGYKDIDEAIESLKDHVISCHK